MSVACKAGVFWGEILELFQDNVVPPSWTLILPESWDESKSVFKGEVDGLVFLVAFQDGGHDQSTSEFSLKNVKNACSAG